jgi:hypothetical protein
MPTISRAEVRSFRAVLRRCLFDGCSRNDWPLLRVRSDGRQVILESARGPLAVRHSIPGTTQPGAIAFRAAVLAEFEGRSNAPVSLEQRASGRGVARWEDGGVPREQTLDTLASDSLPPLPQVAKSMAAMPEGFVEALAEAALTTQRDSGRFALHRVQLCGKDGALVATDGKQLLIQKGFPLPWSEPALVPRLRLSGLPGLSGEEAVTVGRTDTHVVLQVGDWTFFLTIDDKSRFPEVKDVLPRPASIASRWHLTSEDASRLIEILPKLPGHDVDQTPVTVDLGKLITVRGRGTPSGPAAEVRLAGSTFTGTPVRFATDRAYLLRALRLGFTELEIARPSAPVACRDGTRTYGWMLLDASAVVTPDQNMVRLHVPESSITETVEPSVSIRPLSESRRAIMPSPSSNGHPPDDRTAEMSARTGGIDELLSEAESLRQSLSEASVRATRLVAALKLHRRQARAVAAAVSSLRELRIGGP